MWNVGEAEDHIWNLSVLFIASVYRWKILTVFIQNVITTDVPLNVWLNDDLKLQCIIKA